MGPKKLAEIVVPIEVTAATIPIEIKPAIRPYSMAVTPDSSPAHWMNEVITGYGSWRFPAPRCACWARRGAWLRGRDQVKAVAIELNVAERSLPTAVTAVMMTTAIKRR